MKTCIKCGKEIADTAKFCTFCGHDQTVPVTEEDRETADVETILNDEEVQEKEVEKQHQEASEALDKTVKAVKEGADSAMNTVKESTDSAVAAMKETTDSTIRTIRENEKVQKSWKEANNYFKYFVDKLVHAGPGHHQETSYYGHITFALLSLFTAILGTVAVNRLISSFTVIPAGQVHGGISFYDYVGLSSFAHSPFKMTLLLWLSLALMYFVTIGIAYLIIKYLFRVEVNYNRLTNEVAGYLHLVVAATVILIILTGLGLTGGIISMSVIFYGFVMFFVAVLTQMNHYREQSNNAPFNPYLIILFAPLIFYILYALIINLIHFAIK